MRPAYRLMPGIFLFAMFAGDLGWAEIPSPKKDKSAGLSAIKPKGQVLAALPPAVKAGISVDEQNELSEQIFEASGLRKLWRNQKSASIFEQAQLGFMGLLREEIALVNKVYSIVFDPESYYRDLLVTFKRGMNKANKLGVSQWFDSPTGKKIVQLEVDSQSMDIGEKSSAMASQIQTALPSKKRLGAIKKIEKSMDLTNVFIALSQSQLQPFLPLDKEFEGEPMLALLTDLNGSVWIQPLRERMLLSLLYTYRPLTDEELASFAEFVESAHGVWFYQLRKKALIDAQTRINDGVIEQVTLIQQALKSGNGKEYIRQMLPPGSRYLFGQGRDPFNPLSRMKSEVGKVAFARILSQEDDEERKLERKSGDKKSKMPRFGSELRSLHTIPLEVFKNLKRSNKALYQELDHYAFLFKDKKELMAVEDKDYLEAVAHYKELIEKTNRIKGEIILPSPLQVAYEALKPTGIIWGEKEPMALMETSDNLGYTVRKGSLVGPAYGVVEAIDQNKIVVVERERDYLGNVLSKNKEIDFVQSNKQ